MQTERELYVDQHCGDGDGIPPRFEAGNRVLEGVPCVAKCLDSSSWFCEDFLADDVENEGELRVVKGLVITSDTAVLC